MQKTSFKPVTHQPFVVLAYPRTGSYLLVSLLDQFPGLRCYGEVFKKDKVELPAKEMRQINSSIEFRDEEPLIFLKRLCKLNPEEHTGIKFFPSHNAELKTWIVHTKVIKRVAIYRNPFEVYASHLRAVATSMWIDRTGKSKETTPKLVFKEEEFDRMFKNILGAQKFLLSVAEKHPDLSIRIDYEDISKIEPVRKVAAFLGATSQPEEITVPLHKQTTEKYSELFENFEELMKHLKKKHPEVVVDPAKI